MANSNSKSIRYSHVDVAVLFDVTRQAVHNWRNEDGEPYKFFTADDIDKMVAERQADLDRIKARWEIMRMRVEEIEARG